MMLIIVIDATGEIVLQHTLGSGWGILLSGMLIIGMVYNDLSAHVWKAVIVLGLLLTSLVLYRKRLRHFVLSPLCAALTGGVVLVMTSWNQG